MVTAHFLQVDAAYYLENPAFSADVAVSYQGKVNFAGGIMLTMLILFF
jgi:hypothetical protein